MPSPLLTVWRIGHQSDFVGSPFADVDIATNSDTLTYTVSNNPRPTFVSTSIECDRPINAYLPARPTRSSGLDGSRHRSGRCLCREPSDRQLDGRVGCSADSCTHPRQNVNEDTPSILLPLRTYIDDPDVASNNDTLTFTIVPSSGTFYTTSLLNGTLTITLLPNQSGQATITVTGTDGSGQQISDSFELNVLSVNDPPTALARSNNVPANAALNANDATGNATVTVNDNSVLVGAQDVDDTTISAVIVRQPTRGTVVMNLQRDVCLYNPTRVAPSVRRYLHFSARSMVEEDKESKRRSR